MEVEYPLYLVRRKNYAIWKRWKDTNLYMRDLKEDLKFRKPYDWWTYEVLTEKYDFFAIDKDQYNMYDSLNQQFNENLHREIQKHKGCGWEIDD